MKHCRNQYRKQFITQLSAFLLLLLFANALIIQGLHYHHDADVVNHNINKVEKGQKLSHVDMAKISCKLCEIIKQQSHLYYLPDAVTLVLVLENIQKYTTAFVPKHPVRYVLAATNKGPPVINA